MRIFVQEVGFDTFNMFDIFVLSKAWMLFCTSTQEKLLLTSMLFILSNTGAKAKKEENLHISIYLWPSSPRSFHTFFSTFPFEWFERERERKENYTCNIYIVNLSISNSTLLFCFNKGIGNRYMRCNSSMTIYNNFRVYSWAWL